MSHDNIERLYKVFSRYPKPAELKGCPCCTSLAQAKPLLRGGLREIPAAELDHYAFKAMTTWGTIRDYKYFLPRILEQTQEGFLQCDTQITLGKLAYGGFSEWPSDEQQAVHDFVMNWWRDCVRSLDIDCSDALLSGSATFLEDVTPLLELADNESPAFKERYVAEHFNQSKRKLRSSFWNRDSVNYQRVLDWVTAGSVP